VILSVLLLALIPTCLLMAVITVILAQFLRLAGSDESWFLVIQAVVWVLGVVPAVPMLVVYAYLLELLEGLVGVRCPSCRRRDLEWESGHWRYGDPPDYHYFACTNCGARFRQLYGGQGELSDLERI
jgi:hypothetical protein